MILTLRAHIFRFLLFSILQILLIRQFSLFGYAFAFVYIIFLIQLPVLTPRMLLLLIAFLNGLIIDIFNNSYGLHAASCVLMVFCRPFILNLLMPHGGYDAKIEISYNSMGWKWYSGFVFISAIIHHSCIFFLEQFSFDNFLITIFKIILSTFFSGFMIFSIQIVTSKGYK